MLSTWSFLFFSSCASFSTSPAFSYLADCNSGSADAEEEIELKLRLDSDAKKARGQKREEGAERDENTIEKMKKSLDKCRIATETPLGHPHRQALIYSLGAGNSVQRTSS